MGFKESFCFSSEVNNSLTIKSLNEPTLGELTQAFKDFLVGSGFSYVTRVTITTESVDTIESEH